MSCKGRSYEKESCFIRVEKASPYLTSTHRCYLGWRVPMTSTLASFPRLSALPDPRHSGMEAVAIPQYLASRIPT
jgi:hypothetical protein